jgi:hypothetical protein|tara:strand:+ start:2683 stop:3090 length:408 start_codon:yes stop_codon:yes gene_type:complete
MLSAFFIFIQIKMSLPQGKRDFIRKLVTGVSSVMEFDKLLHSTDETDIYIKKHFLVRTDDGSYMVNKMNFCMCVKTLDFDFLCKIFIRLDTYGMTLQKVFLEANVNPLYFSKEEMNYAQLIGRGEIETFFDLVLY